MTAAPGGQKKAAEENAPLGDPEATSPSVDPLEDNEQTNFEVPAPNQTVPEGLVEVTTKAKDDEPADPGGKRTVQKKVVKRTAPKNDPLKELHAGDPHLPLSVTVGDVVLNVEEYSGRAVLSVSLRGWVGDAPFKILAGQAEDIEQALADLRSALTA